MLRCASCCDNDIPIEMGERWVLLQWYKKGKYNLHEGEMNNKCDIIRKVKDEGSR